MNSLAILKQVTGITLGVGAGIALAYQCRKPSWGIGRLFLWIMNVRHSGVTNWGLSHVEIAKDFTVLDVGCGGGRTIRTLATSANQGMVYGVDYSPESVAIARSTNRRLIQTGRVEVRHGSVSRLPFPDGMFDFVSAVETHYYWPNPVADLQEIRRVLKPGGQLVIIAETYRGERFNALFGPAMKVLRANYLSVNEHRDLFSAAGYSEVQVFEERSRGWICVVGRVS